MYYDTFKIERCWDKLHAGSVYNNQKKEKQRQFSLIYQWAKIGHISRKEFLTLVNSVISGDIEIEYGNHKKC